MNSRIEEIKLEVKKCLQKQFVTAIGSQIDEETQKMLLILHAVESFYSRPETEIKNHQTFAAYKSELHLIIDPYWSSPQKKDFSEEYAPLVEALKVIFDPLDTKQSRVQKKERFYAIQEDTTLIKIAKPLKRISFYVSTSPVRFLRLFKKNKQKIPFWRHDVPFKNLVKRHIYIELLPDLTRISNLVYPMISEIYLKIKTLDDGLGDSSITSNDTTFSSIYKQIESLKKSVTAQINKNIDEIVEKRYSTFMFDFERSGTIELSKRKLSDDANEKRLKETELYWSKHKNEWDNVIYALFEDWRTDLDLYSLKHKALAALSEFQLAKTRKLQQLIDPKIKSIVEFIEQGIEDLTKEKLGIQKELKRINYQASKILDKELVPKLSESLSNQPINNLVNKLEASIKQNVEELTSEHVIVKSNTYDSPIKTEEIQIISPHELIEFETLTVFQNEVNAVKKELFNAFEKATSNTKDLDHIVTFSITSAIFSIEEDGKTAEEGKDIALEGLKRAVNRLNETREKLVGEISQISIHLEKSIHQFCKSIIELTINENVRELRLRIIKAKATKQAKNVMDQLRTEFNSKRKQLESLFIKIYHQAEVRAISLGNRFILTAKKPILTKQVSEFLLEYQQAMSNLPVIYKKLYQIEPLQDLELFVGRENEYIALNNAFQSWEKGRFAATIVLGEKWGGLTTFLNYSIKKSQFPYPIKRFAPVKNIYGKEKLMELLKEVFNYDQFDNMDQLALYLNNGSKRIVIIEDMQNLYLRKIGGFETLQLLFQLMAATNKQVFWILTTTIHAWEYLTKTIRIPEYFGYIIEMEELTDEKVTDMIWKRNQISGFNIVFWVDPERLNEKKFSKLGEDEKQALMKNEFFSSLNSFARSNVSLALIFWLLSTKRVDDNSITIGKFKNPDLNFLNVISMDKVYILHALILHDGLTQSQLNEVLSTTNISIKLLLLELIQDGIILERKDVLMVNPIVYRNLISLLKSKNLLH